LTNAAIKYSRGSILHSNHHSSIIQWEECRRVHFHVHVHVHGPSRFSIHPRKSIILVIGNYRPTWRADCNPQSKILSISFHSTRQSQSHISVAVAVHLSTVVYLTRANVGGLSKAEVNIIHYSLLLISLLYYGIV
jgi:hypothetical protein